MQKNHKLLILDDDSKNIKVIKQALRYEDYDIFGTTDPYEAINIFEQELPVLVILDLRMPEMDGIDFLERINMVPDAIFAIIILTGYGTNEDIDRCYELGASAFLRKPVDVKELRGLARNLFEAQNNKIELIKHREELEELVKQRTRELEDEATKRKIKQLELEKSQEELLEKHKMLNEKNIALKEILSHIEEEKTEFKIKIANHVEDVLLPLINKIMKSPTSSRETIVELVRKELDELPQLSNTLDSRFARLTPREIEVCTLIKNGFASKDIASQLDVALDTVHNHRKQIRKKLGIAREKVNLTSYLIRSFSEKNL
ncbi:MAG: response regulator [Candidatus Zixiibacteriota bacterium]